MFRSRHKSSGRSVTLGVGNFSDGVVSNINFLGFAIFTESSMKHTNHGNSIDFKWTGSSSIGCNCFSATKYDISNIDKIILKASVTSHYGTDNFPFYLAVGDFDDVNNYKLTDPRNIPYAKVVTELSLGDIVLELDVSDITGERYIFFSPVGATCTVTDLILEGKGQSYHPISLVQQGTFTSASTTHGTVEVPLDFDADYILVTLPLSETNLTYAIYDKNRMVMNRKLTYWLIPSENNNYQINMDEIPTGETGITWKTENSFTFHTFNINAGNKECTFVAYKF